MFHPRKIKTQRNAHVNAEGLDLRLVTYTKLKFLNVQTLLFFQTARAHSNRGSGYPVQLTPDRYQALELALLCHLVQPSLVTSLILFWSV